MDNLLKSCPVFCAIWTIAPVEPKANPDFLRHVRAISTAEDKLFEQIGSVSVF